LRGDLIEVYTIIGGTDRVDSQSLFPQGGKVNYKRAQVEGERGKFRGDVRGKFSHRGWWVPGTH